jgi:hypothetical protein
MKGVVTASAGGAWVAMFNQANMWSTLCFVMSVGGAIVTWVLAKRTERLEVENATRRHEELMEAMKALLINDARIGKTLVEAITPKELIAGPIETGVKL